MAYADTSVPIAFLPSRAGGLSVITLAVVTSIYRASNSIVTVAVHQAFDTLIASVAHHFPWAIRVRQTVLAHSIDAELVIVALRLTRPTLALLAGATLVVKSACAIGGTSVYGLSTVAASVAAGRPAIHRAGTGVLVASRLAGSVAACVVTGGLARLAGISVLTTISARARWRPGLTAFADALLLAVAEVTVVTICVRCTR